MTTPYIPAQRGAPPAMNWRGYAACRGADPRLFFPDGANGGAPDDGVRAKRVCGNCPVRAACLDWALATGQELGVWGGTAAGERRAMRAARLRVQSPSGLPASAERHHESGQLDTRAHAELAEDLAQVIVDRVR